ncbi:hypothetical protein X992_5482 [Burkholderia pseudomallei MSHR5492]|nr:hypothetical protein X992_5482 [Burkholderia pseudomallei MSHR5492]
MSAENRSHQALYPRCTVCSDLFLQKCLLSENNHLTQRLGTFRAYRHFFFEMNLSSRRR